MLSRTRHVGASVLIPLSPMSESAMARDDRTPRSDSKSLPTTDVFINMQPDATGNNALAEATSARRNGSGFLAPQTPQRPLAVPSSTWRRAAAPASLVTPSRPASFDSPPSSASPTSPHHDRPWNHRGPSPLPSPNIMPPGALRDGLFSAVTVKEPTSPTLSTGSKTDLFFASNGVDSLLVPPRALFKNGRLRRDRPDSGATTHDRSASLPMPALQEIRGFSTTPNDAPAAITLTESTPTTSVTSPSRVVNRSTSSPAPVTDRIFSGLIPSSPLSTLPTLPKVSSITSPRRTSHHFEREHREAPPDDFTLRTGYVLVPCPGEDHRGHDHSWRLGQKLGEGAFSSVWSAAGLETLTTIAAIKLMDKRFCATNARTKIAFIREVEVLRHICHPGIVSFLASFSTPSHYCLVLERLEGGELFELVNDEENRRRMMLPGPGDDVGEGFVRRIFGELVKGVGWLHEVGVVHRDIKLESECYFPTSCLAFVAANSANSLCSDILLTVNPFDLEPTSTSSIALDLLPSPLIKLTDFGLSRFISPTAPLLETRCGSESFAAPEIIMSRPYDGRQTDTWALGVVLYALIVGRLPFDEADEGKAGMSEREERKRRMMRIAKGSYRWPLTGITGSEGVRALVGRLLVRDPKTRARVVEIWDEAWMRGPGEVVRPVHGQEVLGMGEEVDDVGGDGGRRKIMDGFLVDGEEIHQVALAEELEL